MDRRDDVRMLSPMTSSATQAAIPILPGYRLERVLGRGGMGTVYLGLQLSINRAVAIKIPHANRLRNAADVAAFFQEARAACQLHHPGLVTVHDLVQRPEENLYACVMEYVPGVTAGDLVHRDGPLPIAKALAIAGQAAAALAHAHAHGFIHRDVKPENLLVTPAGAVKLLDLGLAYNRVGGLGTGTGSSGGQRRLVILGTPEYAAPEQCRNPDDADETSDVWSLGATLVHLLTGKPPFDGSTVIDLIVNAATRPLDLPPHLTGPVRQLLETFLAKDPDQRYADAGIAAEAIAAVAAGRPPLRPDGSVRPRRRMLPRRRMR